MNLSYNLQELTLNELKSINGGQDIKSAYKNGESAGESIGTWVRKAVEDWGILRAIYALF